MKREEAISIVLKQELKKLGKDERESKLLDIWAIDYEDPEFGSLPDTLKQEILQTDEPVADVMSKRYDPLLMEVLKCEYVGVKNDYLSEQVSKILGEEILVEGEEERLFACPCCMYQTLTERGQFEICPVCFWEDDGSNELTHYSGPNHMTLAEGKSNFIKYGAVAKSSQGFIKHDAKRRYFRHSNSEKEER